MNINYIILLALSILSTSIAQSLLIGGIVAFQNHEISEKRKISFIELTDGLFFSSFFTAVFRVFINWHTNKAGRQYLYGSALFAVITIGLTYFVEFK